MHLGAPPKREGESSVKAERTIEARNARLFTVEQMAELGGWWVGPTRYTLHGPTAFHAELRDKCAQAKALNPELRVMLRQRLDLLTSLAETGGIGTVARQWLLSVPANTWIDGLQPWIAESFVSEIHPHAQSAWMIHMAQDVINASPSKDRRVPLGYWDVDRDAKRLRLHYYMTDLGNADYLDAAIEHLVDSVAWAEADAVLVGVKYAFMAHPQTARLTPAGVLNPSTGVLERPGEQQFPTTLVDTPLLEGEFEAQMSGLVERLSENSVRVVTATDALGRADEWGWLRSDLRGLPLGEHRTAA